MENNKERKEPRELEKSVPHIMVEIIEYMPHSVVSRTVMKRLTGNVTLSSLDTGEGFNEKISPFDTFVQIIEGKAEVVIEGLSKMLHTGEGMIIPAHRSNSIKANERFKMISTIIKSGYE